LLLGNKMNVVGSETLFGCGCIILNSLTDFGSLESIHHKLRIMEEIILAIFSSDESIALLFVELLDSTLHCIRPFLLRLNQR
jgi:hypothetical protein